MIKRPKHPLLLFFWFAFLIFTISLGGLMMASANADSQITVVTVADPYPAPAVRLTPPPIDGVCESWIPLLNKYGIPYSEKIKNVMYRESRCGFLHNYNKRTKDDSWGPFQVNFYGKLAKAYAAAGFSYEFVSTPEGSIAVAAFLYKSCGLGPWTRPYTCKGGWPI